MMLGDTLVNRMDNMDGQYEELTGHFLPQGSIDAATSPALLWLNNLNPNGLPAVAYPLHLHINIVASGHGICKSKCDVDEQCRAYQESRWWDYSMPNVVPTCYLISGMPYRSGYSPHPIRETDSYFATIASGAHPTEAADFFLKITNSKTRSWHQVPKTEVPKAWPTPVAGATVGRRLQGVY